MVNYLQNFVHKTGIMKERVQKIIKLLRLSVQKYGKDQPLNLAGTTAYFTIFAIAPIIIIMVSLAGLLWSEEEIQQKVFGELNTLMGQRGTEYIQKLVDNYLSSTTKSMKGTIIGIIVFIITSTTFFMVLQNSLNYVWRVKAKPNNNILKSLYNRLISFALILSLGFIMLVSLLIDAVISFLDDILAETLPDISLTLLQVGNAIISFAIIMFVFAMIYKFLPDVIIKWKVIWTGALITTILFIAGKFLIGMALGKTDIGSMFGAAGSLVIILIWVFYSSLIFFFGAEITQQYAELYSRGIKPKKNAVKFEIREI